MTLTESLKMWAVEKLAGKYMPNIWNVMDSQRTYGLYDPNNKAAMLAAYKSWIYACVDKRSFAVAGANLRLYVRRGPDELEEIDNHPVLDLLRNPNPWETHMELFKGSIQHADLTGDFYWYIPLNGVGRPGEIWQLPSDRMTIVPHPKKYIAGYKLRNGNEMISFKPEEILHFKYPSSTSLYYGLGPPQASALSANIDQNQHEYQSNFYKNAAIPPFALSTDQKLNETQFKRLRSQFEENYSGVKNSGKPFITDGGLKIEKMGVNPKDLDWLASNRATRDDILGIFGVPASVLGLVEDVNRASAMSNRYSFADNTIEPILSLLDEKLTKDLAQLYDEKLIIKHDSTLPEDTQVEAIAMEARLRAGLTTINEERMAEGYKPIENGDRVLVESNRIFLDMVGETTNANPVANGQTPQDQNQNNNQGTP